MGMKTDNPAVGFRLCSKQMFRAALRPVSPVTWLMRLFSPVIPNMAWVVLERMAGERRLLDYLLMSALITQFLSYWNVWYAWIHWGIVLVLFFCILRLPPQFRHYLKRTRQAGHFLSVPIHSSEFVEAFLHYFLFAVSVCLALELVPVGIMAIQIVGRSGAVPLSSVADLLANMIGLNLYLLSAAWLLYWAMIRGLRHLVSYLVALGGVIASGVLLDFRDNFVVVLLFFGLPLLLFGAGTRIAGRCRSEYMEILCRQFFP